MKDQSLKAQRNESLMVEFQIGQVSRAGEEWREGSQERNQPLVRV